MRTLHKILISCLLALTAGNLFAQYVQPMAYENYSFLKNVNIGNGTAKVTNSSAYLEIGPASGASKGMLWPRLTTTARDAIATPITGLFIYNTTLLRPQYYDGSAWKDIGTIDTSNKWINTLYRRSDSVFYNKGGTETFAFKDSTGGSGGSDGGAVSVRRVDDILKYTNNGVDTTVEKYKKYYGLIYYDSTWSDLSDFHDNGGTWGTSSGVITNSGGAGTFTQTLDIVTNLKTDSGYTCLEHWIIEGEVKVTATGNGFGFGTRPYAAGGNYYLAAQMKTNDGSCTVYHGPSAGSVTTSSSNLTISANDVIVFSIERDIDKVIVTMRNKTTNSAAIITEGYIDYSNVNPPNMGRFCIYAFGGSFEVQRLKISSDETVNPDIGILGDSKGAGLINDYGKGWAALLGNQYNIVNFSGGYTATTDWEKLVPEIIAIAPKQLISINPSNDARLGVNTDSTKARYDRIENALRDAGIDVYHLDGFHETSVDPSAWVAWIQSTKSPDSTFFVYNVTNNAASVAGDGIHVTNYGNYAAYNEIIAENKLKFAKSRTNFNPNDYIKASPGAAQNAFIDLTGSTSINKMNYLKLKGPAGGTTSGNVTTGNVPFFIELYAAQYLRMYGESGTGKFKFGYANSGFTGFYDADFTFSSYAFNAGSTGATSAMTINSSGEVDIPVKLTSKYLKVGSGDPEGAVTANVGAVYHRTDGGAGTSLYIKESGTGNTGWVAAATGGLSGSGTSNNLTKWTGTSSIGNSSITDDGTDISFGNKTIAGGANKYNNQTGTTYTLVSSDNGKIVTLSNASAITLTVPASLPAGFNCTLVQLGAGQVTITPSSTTVNNRQSFTKLKGQYSAAAIIMYATDTFITQGDME